MIKQSILLLEELEKRDRTMIILKPNRMRLLEAEKRRMLVGPRPPMGIHEEDRRERDKKLNLALKKAIK